MSEPEIKYSNFNPDPHDAFLLLFEKTLPGFTLAEALALKQLVQQHLFLPKLKGAILPDIVRALAQKPEINPDHPLRCTIHQSSDIEEDVKVTVFALKAGREAIFPHRKKED